MKATLSLEIAPNLANLNKAISSISKKTESITSTLGKNLSLAKKSFITNLSTAPSSELSKLSHSIKTATMTKLRLDTQEAKSKIASLSADIVGVGASLMALAKPITIAMGFESSMADVKKVVTFESDKELKAFENEIWNLTKTIPLAAKDLTKIVASGGQMGLDKKVLIPFTDTVAKMSTAFDMSAEQAGNSIASLMKKMNLGIEEVSLLGDAINHLGANSAGAPREIVEILGRIGGMAKMVGLSKEATAGLAGAFANMKIPADQAGTAINKMLNVLGSVDTLTPNAKQALEDLGIDAQELQKTMLEDPKQGIQAILTTISQADREKKGGILKRLFGEEAGPKIAQITENMGEFRRMMELTADPNNYRGSMQKEFDEVAKTTANKLAILNNAFSNISNTIGSILLPHIASLAQKIEVKILKLNEWVKENTGLIKGLMALGGGLVGAKVASLSFSLALTGIKSLTLPIRLFWASCIFSSSIYQKRMILATSITRIFSSSLSLMASVGKKSFSLLALCARVSLTSIKRALISTGIGALIVGLGVALEQVYTHWDTITSKMLKIWESFKESISPIINWIKETVSSLLEPLSFITDSSIFKLASQGIGSITGGISSALSSLGSFVFGEDKDTPQINQTTAQEVPSSPTAQHSLIAETFGTPTSSTQTTIYDQKTINIYTQSQDPKQIVQAIRTHSYSD